MRTVRIDLGAGRAYPIRIGAGLLGRGECFRELRNRDCRVITDQTVAIRYLAPMRQTAGIDAAHCLVLPPGEEQKSLETAGRVLDWLLESRLPRDGAVVALGGGVIGDLAGFAAAICQRGVDVVQVPTTLLAQVDSSVGGKTGVNHPRGKNLVGAFHQPRAVIADLDTLATLPARELRAGIAEVIKYGLLGDAAFFGWLERHVEALLALDRDAIATAVVKCCRMKARIVAADERESGARALLNLGHTFGHAIETHARYRNWLHGEAVAVGLCMAADLSQRLGMLGADAAARVPALVARAGLPTRPPADLTADGFLAHMAHDKKAQAGRLRLVLLRAIGRATITADFDPAALRATLERFGSP